MTARMRLSPILPSTASSPALRGSRCHFGPAGCANMGDSMSTVRRSAKYELYDCAVEPERKNLAERLAALQGLMSVPKLAPQAPSWPNSPIATNTSRCAGNPDLPKKPGNATNASPPRRLRPPRRRLRLTPRRHGGRSTRAGRPPANKTACTSRNAPPLTPASHKSSPAAPASAAVRSTG